VNSGSGSTGTRRLRKWKFMDSASRVHDRPHKRLEAWKKGVEFVTLIYEITREFPREEEFGPRRL